MSKPEMNEITPKAKASFRNRVIVAAVLVAILIPTFVIGGWVFFIAVALFLGIAVHEMVTVTGKKYPWYLWLFAYIIVFSFTYWFVIKSNLGNYLAIKEYNSVHPASTEEFHFSLEEHFGSLDISVIGITVAIGIYFLMGIIGHTLNFDDVSFFITFSIMLGLGFQAAFFCRYYPFYLYKTGTFEDVKILGMSSTELIGSSVFKYAISGELLAFVVLGTTANDTFAYIFGSLWGKHKLNEKVSPHKTWEGFWFGWLGGTIVCLIFGLTLTFCGFPMLPTLTSSTWYWVVLLSVVIPLLGDLGDLSFSFIKRHYAVKDYGTILQGHGGMIDRVGSDLFACLGTAVILIFITNSWNLFI
jgi:CDP-diglyceride synthetase